MTRKQLITIFFIVLLLYILANVLFVLSRFLNPIFWGIVLAFAFYPIYEKCLPLAQNNRNLAAILTTVLILLAFVPLLIFIALQGAKETVHFYDELARFVKEGGAERTLQNLRESSFMQKIESLNLIQWETAKNQFKEWVLNSAGGIGNFVLKHATLLTKNIVTGVFDFFLTFFLLFFFLRDGRLIYQFIYDATPLDEENKEVIFNQLSDTFSATLRGQLFTALAQSAALGIVFWCLGLPLPVFFAAVTFLASMIPVFGASTVWVPFTIYFGITQQWSRMAALLFLGIFAISSIDNILKPLLIGPKTKLPYSLLFLAILGGIQAYGFIGIFIGPAFFSLFFVLVKIYRDKFSASTVS
jgi:predicted PurR-regulated permease PerM